MIDNKTIDRCLFVDIEVVTEYSTVKEFQLKNPKFFKHWEKIIVKYAEEWGENDLDIKNQQAYEKYGPLYPEFSKIVSVAFGGARFNYNSPAEFKINVKSVADESELALLTNLGIILNKMFENNPAIKLCGHNIIEYDIPFLIKRFIKNNIVVPNILKNTIDRKPWELEVLDTIRLWKFGGQRFASLELITDFLDLKSSKSDMDGSMVGPIYWTALDKKEAVERISKYNEDDVKSVIELIIYLSQY